MDKFPDEIFFEIFSLLDLAAIRKVREVSKKWKFLVPYIRPNLHFVCHITDDTFKYAVNSEEEFVRLEVHDFSGKGNDVVSSTNGTGLLFGNAEYIIFTGNNIEPGEIPKMMQFAVDSVETLEFQNCEIDTLRPFIDAKQSFTALKKLSIKYTRFPKANDTLALEGIATLESGPLLPSLISLKISLDDPDTDPNPSFQDIFLHYLAIGKMIVKYRRSLKDVEIERTSKFRRITGWRIEAAEEEGFVLSPAQNTQLQQCLAAFQEMTLDKLSISPENAENPWIVETQLLKRQQTLKELVIDQPVRGIEEWPNLTSWLPNNRASLTSVKMKFMFYADGGPMDLGAFTGCPNLKTLWLVFFHENDENGEGTIWNSAARFSNVEALPKTISSLRLKCDNQDVRNRDSKHQLFILSPEQVQWIIENLRDLESMWTQFVLEPKNNGQNAQQPRPRAPNRQPNMTLKMFEDLISLPKLRTLKLDMLKVKQLDASFDDAEEDVVEDKENEFTTFVISLGEIQEYIDICKNSQKIGSVSRYPVQGQQIRFWEVTIHTSNST